MVQRNFEEEREQARHEAERLATFLQAHGYEVGEIDWERAGRLAYVPVNAIEVGDLITLSGSNELGRLLEDVRYKLLEATAQLLQDNAGAASWTPLELPGDAPAEMVSLWRIHLGEDEKPGVNVVEIVRDGKRSYEHFAGGAQPGAHSFNVDTISVQAIHAIKEQGGSVTYNPSAQRADDVQGRRKIVLPEGTQQTSEGEQFMAPQRFRLPNGVHLRLVPEWYTVELDVITKEGLE